MSLAQRAGRRGSGRKRGAQRPHGGRCAVLRPCGDLYGAPARTYRTIRRGGPPGRVDRHGEVAGCSAGHREGSADRCRSRRRPGRAGASRRGGRSGAGLRGASSGAGRARPGAGRVRPTWAGRVRPGASRVRPTGAGRVRPGAGRARPTGAGRRRPGAGRARPPGPVGGVPGPVGGVPGPVGGRRRAGAGGLKVLVGDVPGLVGGVTRPVVQLGAVMVSSSRVTAPLRASARPAMVSPVSTEIDVRARMVPAKVELCSEGGGTAHLPEDVAGLGAVGEDDGAGRVGE